MSDFFAGMTFSRFLHHFIHKVETFMAKIDEVMAKLDERDQQIADEHAQAAQVLADLQATKDALQEMIDNGASGPQLQAIADRLDTQGAALKDIIPDEPVPEPTPVEPPTEPTPPQ